MAKTRKSKLRNIILIGGSISTLLLFILYFFAEVVPLSGLIAWVVANLSFLTVNEIT